MNVRINTATRPISATLFKGQNQEGKVKVNKYEKSIETKNRLSLKRCKEQKTACHLSTGREHKDQHLLKHNRTYLSLPLCMPILCRVLDSSILCLPQHVIFQQGPHVSSFSYPTTWHVACSWAHVPISTLPMQNQPSVLSSNARCHPCWISDGHGCVFPSQITIYQTPTSQATTLPTLG